MGLLARLSAAAAGPLLQSGLQDVHCAFKLFIRNGKRVQETQDIAMQPAVQHYEPLFECIVLDLLYAVREGAPDAGSRSSSATIEPSPLTSAI